MQSQKPPNDFVPTYNRTALSSQIVRPLFQREGGVRYSAAYKAFPRGGKRSLSPERPRETSVTRSVLPSSTTPTFMSSSELYSAPVSNKYQSEERFLASLCSLRQDNPAPTNREDPFVIVANCASQQADHSETDQPQSKRKRIRLKTARRREQCRANQARYRKKQVDHAETLEQTVQKLRADIPVLELQCNRLHYGGQNDIWGVVVEYFQFFRFGVPVKLPLSSVDELHMRAMRADNAATAQTKQQRAFLSSSMTNNVILGERRGVDALMDQWRRYSSSFQNLYFQLKRISRASDQFVSASATLSVTVSDTTIRRVFPHLLDEAQDGQEEDGFMNDPSTAFPHNSTVSRPQGSNNASRPPTLRSRLLGQRLELPCSLCFEWDASRGRVSRLETTINFLTPLMKALGNLSDVALVLQHARITRDGAVGIQDQAS